MWANPHFTAEFSHLPRKSLSGSFIFLSSDITLKKIVQLYTIYGLCIVHKYFLNYLWISLFLYVLYCSWNRLQNSLLLLSQFKRIEELLFHVKWSKNHSDDFRGTKNWTICLNSLNIRSEIWRLVFNVDKC